jgi:chromosomal replication initiator protein
MHEIEPAFSTSARLPASNPEVRVESPVLENAGTQAELVRRLELRRGDELAALRLEHVEAIAALRLGHGEEIAALRAGRGEAAAKEEPASPRAAVALELPARDGVDSVSRESSWRLLQQALRARVQPEQFETWFRRAALTRADATGVTISVQNPFTRDWIQTYYRGVIEDSLAEVFGGPRRLEFEVDPELVMASGRDRRTRGDDDPADTAGPADRSPNGRESGSQVGSQVGPRGGGSQAASRSEGFLGNARTLVHEGQLVSDIGLNPKYTFDNFVVGPCNRFAHAAAVGAAEQPGKAYNPFFLHGSVGLGKTHLLQSLCFALLQRNPETRILYLSCETFVNHFINALENGDLQKFRNKYRNVDVLVVDDIHVLANKERTQEEFFHTFNTLYQAGKQIVLSSDSPPKDIPTLQERLVSRFKWGLVTEIEPPCYETRMAIMKRKSREKGREIPDDVARLVAERVESNIRELEGAVTKLIGYSQLSGAPITPDLAREVLRDLFVKRKGAPSMEDIIAVVTEHFGVKLSELQSRKRTNAIAYPRQVAMYLARQITRHSLEEIGGFFGGRDHSTVLYAVDKVGDLAAADPACREILDEFLSKLQGPGS